MSGATLVILAAGRARRYGGLKQLAPIGWHREGVIDLLASDAMTAGFDTIVLVVNRETGPSIMAHVAERWPSHIHVEFAYQESLRGTVDAVLSARHLVDPAKPFAISNADDLYGPDAFAKMAAHLSQTSRSCLIAYELENSLVGDLPVSRGVCEVHDGRLVNVTERRNVTMTPSGCVADDGLEPAQLDQRSLVSMNLWGFQSDLWPALQQAVDDHDFEESAEVLLPTFVATVMHRDGVIFDVVPTSSRCIGVTHADDLPLAQFLVREEIKQGLRPERAFTSPF